MPRRAAPPPRTIAPKTLVVDNGGYTIKAGYASASPSLQDCQIIPNCIARSREKKTYVGSRLHDAEDYGEMQFRRPVEKGFVVNWESERAVWEESFFGARADVPVDPHETNLILTEASNCPQALQTNCDQIVFEEFEFAAYHRTLASILASHNDIQSLFPSPSPSPSTPSPPPSGTQPLLLIDSGYSHTLLTPLLTHAPLQSSCRRLDIGGKLLTNLLKESLSIRNFSMIDELHLVNAIKECLCHLAVSPADFSTQLDRNWKAADPTAIVDVVLPDYSTRSEIVCREHDPSASAKRRNLLGGPAGPREYVLPIGNEKFAVPELLFRPTDIGLQEAGLPDVAMRCLENVPQAIAAGCLANVVVMGGNAKMAGFAERLSGELRMLVPEGWGVRVGVPEDPVKFAWMGGARWAGDGEGLKDVVVTREEYLENGAGWLLRKFSNRGA
ncbi:Actin/actin-like protein [Eremomyces bilateralis CBS 781.70]|uniref:Actin/actin-like protein n=1 Tax=Eremomyces bilateralis CBS 781.70 TaxID=1392243 RepID=A0A6G1G4J8_9PEZI|nr:Actin/actin-like protein [Eremomyces bilateralis CBS 781.70]KAF1812871.1 Actin/actin-like protein [Eremomyces bilateralis CBS 781.70]